MSNSEAVQEPQVGDIWYRYEDRACSVTDEWGEHSHSTLEWSLMQFPVVRVTPYGVWIAAVGIHDMQGGRKFINHAWTKKFAHPTKELALESLVARRKCQASIYRARADWADHVISAVEMNKQKLLNMKGY